MRGGIIESEHSEETPASDNGGAPEGTISGETRPEELDIPTISTELRKPPPAAKL